MPHAGPARRAGGRERRRCSVLLGLIAACDSERSQQRVSAGGFASVYLCEDTESGEQVVLKRMQVPADHEDNLIVARSATAATTGADASWGRRRCLLALAAPRSHARPLGREPLRHLPQGSVVPAPVPRLLLLSGGGAGPAAAGCHGRRLSSGLQFEATPPAPRLPSAACVPAPPQPPSASRSLLCGHLLSCALLLVPVPFARGAQAGARGTAHARAPPARLPTRRLGHLWARACALGLRGAWRWRFHAAHHALSPAARAVSGALRL